MTTFRTIALVAITTLAAISGNTANAQLFYRLAPRSTEPTKFRTTPYEDVERAVKQVGPMTLYSTGRVHVEGSDAADECIVHLTAQTMYIVYESAFAPPAVLMVKPGVVNLIEFDGKAGDDVFAVEGVEHMAMGLHQFDCDLRGGDGTDFLQGAMGNDILDGGADYNVDYLVGGEGSDTFVRYYVGKIATDGQKHYYWHTQDQTDKNYWEGDSWDLRDSTE